MVVVVVVAVAVAVAVAVGVVVVVVVVVSCCFEESSVWHKALKSLGTTSAHNWRADLVATMHNLKPCDPGLSACCRPAAGAGTACGGLACRLIAEIQFGIDSNMPKGLRLGKRCQLHQRRQEDGFGYSPALLTLASLYESGYEPAIQQDAVQAARHTHTHNEWD